MRILGLSIVLLVTAALAGCSSGDDDPTDPTPSPTPTPGPSPTPPRPSPTPGVTPSPSPSPSPTPSPGENEAPVAVLEAEINGLTVNFTVKASDPDGDVLTWVLSFGDGEDDSSGEALPADVEHAYATAGPYTATLTVSDGEDDNVKTLELALSAGAKMTVIFTGHVTSADPFAVAGGGCLGEAIHHDLGTPAGTTGDIHDLEPAVWGWSYAFAAPGYIAEFWSDEPSILGSGPSGTVPADAVQVFVCADDPAVANTDYTLTLTSP